MPIKPLRYLAQGLHSKKELELYFQLTKISSESIRDALTDHLVRNISVSDAAYLNDVKQGNVSRALDTLNEIARVVELIHEQKSISVK